MYRGKYNSRKRVKHNKRIHILLASLVLILGLGIGMTAAYLLDTTGSVTNTFTPAEVNVSVDETFANNVKTNIGATNNSTVKAYVRITLVEYWKKGNDIVAKPDDGRVNKGDLSESWLAANGIYYYKEPLAPGASAPAAIAEVTAEVPEGYTYHLDVYAEAIQAEPTNAVVDSWGVTLTGTTITAVS